MVSGLMSPSPPRKRCNADLVVDFLRATPLKLASINEATKEECPKILAKCALIDKRVVRRKEIQWPLQRLIKS
jgi:hypothetical protein